VIGFSDEEGVRYQTTYLGSRALAGTLTRRDLALIEEKGIERAKRRRNDVLAYAEVHIEQGPVLEAENLALGVVRGIAGQSRISVIFTGRAGHAGTTPMRHRRDALCAAAEFILAVENCGVTATVGQIAVEPEASNVIPARALLSLDIRDLSDSKRRAAIRGLQRRARAIAARRKTALTWKLVQETGSVTCDRELSKRLAQAVARHQAKVPTIPSGAGHDAAAMSAICPVAMLFVRCKGGISHHPAESVKAADVARAIAAFTDFVLLLRDRHA
jgi:allantoate deiminase